MRNVSRFLAIVGVVAVIVAVATPQASAGCPNPKIAATFSNANYVYIGFDGVTPAQVKGRFYVAGNPSVGSTAAYGPETWLFVDIGGNLSMSANLSEEEAKVTGCPAGKLVTQLQATTPSGVKFLTLTAIEGENPASSVSFDYSNFRPTASIIPGVPLPRPRVTSSARGTGVVNLQLGIDSTAAGNAGDSAGAVTGYDIVRASGADPGRDPAGWTLVQTVASPNGAPASLPVTADCSNPSVDQFFATRLVFGDGQKSSVVSDSTRVNCNPALAEPRFNVVPKKPTGPKKQPAR